MWRDSQITRVNITEHSSMAQNPIILGGTRHKCVSWFAHCRHRYRTRSSIAQNLFILGGTRHTRVMWFAHCRHRHRTRSSIAQNLIISRRDTHVWRDSHSMHRHRTRSSMAQNLFILGGTHVCDVIHTLYAQTWDTLIHSAESNYF